MTRNRESPEIPRHVVGWILAVALVPPIIIVPILTGWLGLAIIVPMALAGGAVGVGAAHLSGIRMTRSVSDDSKRS